MTERRSQPFVVDQEKFSTQRTVTYALLLIFAAVAGWVLYQNDQSERSMVLQTVINLTLLAVGYWLGASKAAADSTATVGKIAESAAPTQAAAVAAARSDPVPPAAPAVIPVEPMPVEIVAGPGKEEPMKTQETPQK